MLRLQTVTANVFMVETHYTDTFIKLKKRPNDSFEELKTEF